MAGSECNPTTIPTVDNSTPDCVDIVKEQCVVMTRIRTNPIAIAVNDELDDVIDALLQHIINLEARIIVLENYNITNP